MRLFGHSPEHTYKGKEYELTLRELHVLQVFSWRKEIGFVCAVNGDELDHAGGLPFELDDFNRVVKSLAGNGLLEIDHYTNDETGHRRPPIVTIDPMPNEHLWRHYARLDISPKGEQELRHALATQRNERRANIMKGGGVVGSILLALILAWLLYWYGPPAK